MSIKNIRAKVIGTVWQAIAQSDIDLSSVKEDDQTSMVNRIADSVILAIDSMLEDEVDFDIAADNDPDHKETILWKGRPLLSLVEHYLITDERLKIVNGLLSRDVENFELIRLQDIDYTQAFSERILGIGDIQIRGHDSSSPEIILRNVAKPEEVYEILRKAWLVARKKHGLQFREYM